MAAPRPSLRSWRVFTATRTASLSATGFFTITNRPADPARLVGSPEKIKAELGWQPRGSFQDLVREMVEAELAAIDAGADVQA